MHGTFIRLSFYYHSIPFPSANSLCVSLALLRANDSIPDPIQASKKAIASLYNFSFVYIAHFIPLLFLFKFCPSYSCKLHIQFLYEHILGGLRLFLFPALLCFQSSFQRCSHFPFNLFRLCCIYLRSSYSHNCAVIIVEGGLQAVMMFAKTPPDEEQ